MMMKPDPKDFPNIPGSPLARAEYLEQVAVFEWAARMEYKWPCLKLLFGSLMGVKLSPKYLNKCKKAGMKKGKPDINLPVPMGGYCGLWIELKRIDGDFPKDGDDQDLMLKNLFIVGNSTHICKGSKNAIWIIEQYLKGKIRVKNKRAPFNPTAPLF
jgi:hypothetical protein